jgi:hypothetical protein
LAKRSLSVGRHQPVNGSRSAKAAGSMAISVSSTTRP